MQRYFAEPYRFVPPYRPTRWCWLARWAMPTYLRRAMHVHHWQFLGLDRLRASLGAGHGILLTPNHSRWPDAGVMGQLSVELGNYFYYLLSSHLLRQGGPAGTILHRLGSFPILREGTDTESLRTCARILSEAERPLVIFPEGTWFRRNDCLGPLQEGVPLIARLAEKAGSKPVVIHPVAIKYWTLADPTPTLDRWLTAHGQPPKGRPLVERIEAAVGDFLAVREREVLGSPQAGDLDHRIDALTKGYIVTLERRFADGPRDGLPIERIRWLRQRLVKQLQEALGKPAEVQALLTDLETLLFAENLSAHSAAYLRERPSWERLTESVQRLEETLTDRTEVPAVPLRAVVEVGAALKVADFPKPRGADRAGGDPLLAAVRDGIQGMLDRRLADGPPNRK